MGAVLAFLWGLRRPHLELLAILPCLLVLGGCVREDREPRLTTLWSAWFFLDRIATGIRLITYPEDERGPPWLGWVYVMTGPLMCVVWWRLRHRPTLALYGVLYLYFGTGGVRSVTVEAWEAATMGGVDAFYVADGLINLLPVVVVVLGQERVYNSAARRFEQSKGRTEQVWWWGDWGDETVVVCMQGWGR